MRAVIADMPPHWLKERKTSGADQWDEVWEGVLHVSPSPTRKHQDLEMQLSHFLRRLWAKPHGNRVNQQVNLTTLRCAMRRTGSTTTAFPIWFS